MIVYGCYMIVYDLYMMFIWFLHDFIRFVYDVHMICIWSVYDFQYDFHMILYDFVYDFIWCLYLFVYDFICFLNMISYGFYAILIWHAHACLRVRRRPGRGPSGAEAGERRKKGAGCRGTRGDDANGYYYAHDYAYDYAYD